VETRNIVVIGASAGGVQTLKSLVRGLPASFPGTVLVVLHVPSHTPSQLQEVLSRVSSLPATAAVDGERVKQGRIYVASSDRHLLIEKDRLRVTRGPKENRSRPAIDALFRSAAYTCGPRVIGIVLSGMLDDGTAGLWAIKDRGGLAVVQSPEEAEYPSMPQSALQYVEVDATLPVAEMPKFLEDAISEHFVTDSQGTALERMEIEHRVSLEGSGLHAGVMKLGPVSPNTCPECHGVLVRICEGSITRYRCHTGHAFSLQSLLADVNDEIDRTLWNAARSIEERILLLREMADAVDSHKDRTNARRCTEQADAAERYVEQIRKLVLSHELFARIPSIGSPHVRVDSPGGEGGRSEASFD